MKTFTIIQIKKYLESQDSLGDIHHYLSEENIIKANKTCRTCKFRIGEECDGKYEGKEVYDDDVACDWHKED